MFIGKCVRALLFSAFVFAVMGDPITDVLFPHQGSCDVCAALAGGCGVISADTGPDLSCDFTEFAAPPERNDIAGYLVFHPTFLSRAPPAV